MTLTQFKIRCSSLALIMTTPKEIDAHLVTPEVEAIKAKTSAKRTPEEAALLKRLLDESLSAGAKTHVQEFARELVYGYHTVIGSKYMEKGLIVEDEAIALYNDVFFTNHKKNKERRENEWLTGECDIYDPDARETIDTKSSWAVNTFPATPQEGEDITYEWQGRGYMMLWDTDMHKVAYCLVNTPPELIKYEQEDLHFVDHIDERLRVTIVKYPRCPIKEALIKTKVEACQRYLVEYVRQIEEHHRHEEAA